MINTFGNKLRQLRESYQFNGKKLSGEKLAEILGISQGFVSAMERGDKMPGRELTSKIAQFFNVPVDYLISNTDKPTGEAFEQDASSSVPEHLSVHSVASNVQQIIPSENFRFIPVVSLKPCAGKGNAYADFNWDVEDFYPVRNVDVLGHSWQGGDFKMAVIEGSSMEPKYHNGDYVLFVVGENYSDGDIVVASWYGKLYIRGFFSNSNGIELRPRAQGYETIFVPKGDERLQIFGKVLRSYPQPRKELGFYN